MYVCMYVCIYNQEQSTHGVAITAPVDAALPQITITLACVGLS